jgi:NAD(P)-dependent dehydrogenase (short-subunit alcohol dehydrogenase family)
MSAYSGSKLAAHTVVDYLQAENPEMKCFSLSPGIIYTDMNVKSGVPKEMANDTVELPAHFSVWLASPESDFLKGKFLWANWDVDDLKALKGKIEADPSVLKVTLGGWPTFSSLA